MKALISFWPLLARQRGRLVRALLLSLLTLTAGIGLLGVSGWFLTAAALSTAGVAFNLFGPSAGVRGLSFIRILSRYGEKLAGHDATLRLLSDIRQWLFARLFAAIPLPGAGLRRADLVSRFVADVETLDNAYLTALGPITTAVAAGLAMTFALLALLPAAALAYAACFFGVALLLPVGLVTLSRRAGTEIVAASAALRQAVLDGLDAHQDLTAMGQTAQTADAAAVAADRVAASRRRLGLLGAAASGATQLLIGVAMVAVLVAGIAAFGAGRIGGPLLAGILLAVVASFEAAAPLVRSATRLSSAAAAAERLQSVATSPPTVAEPAEPSPVPLGGRIALSHVRFGYDPRRPVLNDVSLTVPDGGHVAIVGPSGAGKSTIAQLLVRLADPEAGCVCLGETDVRQLALGELRRRVVLMTQDAPVFNDTIRANLRIGSPDADDAALWRALREAELVGVVEALPRGLDTLVGEAGATLSAGQARRLALARTLLSPARVLVLDEPTSGLDRETELAFFRNLARVGSGRTIIVITHAALPVRVVDCIYRLVDGRLEPADKVFETSVEITTGGDQGNATTASNPSA